MAKVLVFKVKRAEVVEFRVPFEGQNPPFTEEDLALGTGLEDVYDLEETPGWDEEVVWEDAGELEPGSYRVEEAP